MVLVIVLKIVLVIVLVLAVRLAIVIATERRTGELLSNLTWAQLCAIASAGMFLGCSWQGSSFNLYRGHSGICIYNAYMLSYSHIARIDIEYAEDLYIYIYNLYESGSGEGSWSTR